MRAPLHAFVISWSGQADKAARIAAALAGAVDKLTVIHSDEAPQAPLPEGWVRVPNDWFYGRKFRRALELFEGGVMLHVTADVSCDDWPALAARCRGAFGAVPALGLWSANVEGTYWTVDHTGIGRLGETPLCFVARVDEIVWAMTDAVAQRMRGLDYDCNNFGWGIARLASLHCLVTSRLMVVDEAARVIHPLGTGYSEAEAHAQSAVFMGQATPAERLQDALVHGFLKRPRS